MFSTTYLSRQLTLEEKTCNRGERYLCITFRKIPLWKHWVCLPWSNHTLKNLKRCVQSRVSQGGEGWPQCPSPAVWLPALALPRIQGFWFRKQKKTLWPLCCPKSPLISAAEQPGLETTQVGQKNVFYRQFGPGFKSQSHLFLENSVTFEPSPQPSKPQFLHL